MLGKLNRKKLSFILILSLMIGVIGQENLAEASADKKGKYIYYAYSVVGEGTAGIMRYDTSSGKNKKIVSYKLKGESTNGFSDIAVSGKYIFATWNQYYGTDGDCNYVYCFSKDGKKKKKLSVGSLYMVLENYVYYFEEKETYEWYGVKMTEPTGYLCKMKLNGKSKTKVLNLSEVGWYGSFEGKLVYADSENSEYVYTETGDKIKRTALANAETYVYKVNDDDFPTKIYRENRKTGKTKVIASFKEGIYEWEVCGDYVMLVAASGSYEMGDQMVNVYCISKDGKNKKKLASWQPAG